jgi:hypothetical protein
MASLGVDKHLNINKGMKSGNCKEYEGNEA